MIATLCMVIRRKILLSIYRVSCWAFVGQQPIVAQSESSGNAGSGLMPAADDIGILVVL